jgi:hypothetical protein
MRLAEEKEGSDKQRLPCGAAGMLLLCWRWRRWSLVVHGGPWWCLVVLVWSCVCMKRAGRGHCRHGHSHRRDGSRQDGRWRALTGWRWAEGGQRAALCEDCKAATAAGVPLSVPQITMGSAPAKPWAARRRRRRPLACLGRQRQ